MSNSEGAGWGKWLRRLWSPAQELPPPVRFSVSDVNVNRTRLATCSIEQAIHLQTSCNSWSHEDSKPMRPPLRPCDGYGAARAELVGAEMHPFAEAVHRAFDEHRPLRLSPDALWLVIAQGLGLHVQHNAEELRERFVQHQGKDSIKVRRDDFAPGRANPWHEMIDSFRAKLRERIGAKHDLFVSDFSTTDQLSLTASSVVLMGAMQHYFDYTLVTRCGIPEIILEGTVDDYRAIRRRVRYFDELSLGWWADTLMPVLDAFVAAAEGRVDRGFWQSMYKLNNESGGPYITGWLQLLFPYIGSTPQRNPHHENWRQGMESVFGGGPASHELPPGLSQVPFRWLYFDEVIEMELLGGFIGIEQDRQGAIAPSLGWAVRRRLAH